MGILLHALFAPRHVHEQRRVVGGVVGVRETEPRAPIVSVRLVLPPRFDILSNIGRRRSRGYATPRGYGARRGRSALRPRGALGERGRREQTQNEGGMSAERHDSVRAIPKSSRLPVFLFHSHLLARSRAHGPISIPKNGMKKACVP